METISPTEVGQRVRADIERISTRTKVCEGTGIAATTLDRRLRTGNFTIAELFAIATFLRADPAVYLRAAEHDRAAA